MEQSSRHTKLAALLMLSAGLSFVLPGVFSAPVLRAIHLAYGGLKYWLLSPILGIALWLGGLVPAGLGLLTAIGSVGVYRELEARGRSGLSLGFFSVLMGLVIAGVGLWLWSYQEGWILLDKTKQVIQDFIKDAGPVFSGTEDSEGVNLNLLVAQVPSLVSILIVVGLALSLVFERVVLSVFGIRGEREARRHQLRKFRVPDFLVWVSLIAFLITVVDFGWAPLTAAGANALNVMVILYFFQGLAIVESFLRHYGVSWIWRFLTYTLLVLQLFFLPIFFGFVDFWFGFRERLKRKESDAKETEKD